jgi:hypothetical protein
MTFFYAVCATGVCLLSRGSPVPLPEPARMAYVDGTTDGSFPLFHASARLRMVSSRVNNAMA